MANIVMQVKTIKTKKQYKEYLQRFNEIFDAKKGTPESDEFDLLALVIEKYEEEKYPMEKHKEMTYEEESFSHGVRIYTETLINTLETKGEMAAKVRLRETFGDETLKLFPENLTKENLSKTLMGLKQDKVVYREEKYNDKQKE